MSIWLVGFLAVLFWHCLIVNELKKGCKGFDEANLCELFLQQFELLLAFSKDFADHGFDIGKLLVHFVRPVSQFFLSIHSNIPIEHVLILRSNHSSDYSHSPFVEETVELFDRLHETECLERYLSEILGHQLHLKDHLWLSIFARKLLLTSDNSDVRR